MEIWVPNAFTPGNDPLNNEFLAYGSGIAEFNMIFFDRWGEKIFETDTINKGWDGTYKDKTCPEGVYVYNIKARGIDGSKQVNKSGHLSLIR